MIKTSHIKIGTKVCVKWLDTISFSQWITQEDFINSQPAVCATVGVWMGVGNNRKTCAIAHSVSGDSFCDGSIIPLGCVTEIKIWED